MTFTWASGASRTRGIILRVRKDLDWPEVTHKLAEQLNGMLLFPIVFLAFFSDFTWFLFSLLRVLPPLVSSSVFDSMLLICMDVGGIAWTLQPATRRPMGYWTNDHNSNMRAFMCGLATRHRHPFDPLIAAEWYRLTKDFLLSEPVSNPISFCFIVLDYCIVIFDQFTWRSDDLEPLQRLFQKGCDGSVP